MGILHLYTRNQPTTYQSPPSACYCQRRNHTPSRFISFRRISTQTTQTTLCIKACMFYCHVLFCMVLNCYLLLYVNSSILSIIRLIYIFCVTAYGFSNRNSMLITYTIPTILLYHTQKRSLYLPSSQCWNYKANVQNAKQRYILLLDKTQNVA